MSILENKTIKSVFLSLDETCLVFEIKGSSVKQSEYVCWQTDGDCCSESWFADIVGVVELLNAKVKSVSEISIENCGYNVEDGRGRQDYDRAYGYKIITNKGYADIVFRNSSNGYYGGTMAEITLKSDSDFKIENYQEIKNDYGVPGSQVGLGDWISKIEKTKLDAELKKNKVQKSKQIKL